MLIENSIDILAIIDASTLHIEKVNKALFKILEYSPQEVIGKSILDVFGQNVLPFITQMRSENQAQFQVQVFTKTKTGKTKWLRCNAKEADGKLYINAGDITQSKEAEEEIKHLNSELGSNMEKLEIVNKELEAFSYSVSHDLMAPVRSIRGFANILEEDSGQLLDEEGLRNLGVIKKSADRMKNLITDLLAFSKISRSSIKKSSTKMDELVDTVIKDLTSNGLKAQFKIGSILSCNGDPSLLTQVWINLLSNAIKYSSKSSSPLIEINSYHENNAITYLVKDNGAGFDMEYASNLFKVFQRLHHENDFEGTGIGLASVHRIISRHGGRVWAEGKPQEGATFYFSIPDESLA